MSKLVADAYNWINKAVSGYHSKLGGTAEQFVPVMDMAGAFVSLLKMICVK